MCKSQVYKILLFVLLLSLSQIGFAQDKLEFNVVSFKPDLFSIFALDKQLENKNIDKESHAIIKVKSADRNGGLEGFTFNFGVLNHIVISHGDELWIYVQRNAKTVTIKREGYKTIDKYNLNTTIQPGKVYEMVISMSRVVSRLEHQINKQILQFIVTPADENAIVKIKKADSSSDYDLWGAVDETGSIDKMMEFGTYDYIISAANHESSVGRVTLTDSRTTYTEKVILKPNFGFLVVDDAYGIAGAQLFVDDVKVGTIPYRDANKRWDCGEHKIAITNGDLYKTYSSTFVIQQGDTTHLSPKLESDFAQTTIRVNADAEIFVDGISKGRKMWTGPLKAGKYVVECKQENHEPTSISINVKADKAETFEVPAPTAITGSLYVRSNPTGAMIEIDGMNNGNTPKLIQGLLIGDHVVRLTLANHKTEQYNISVKEGETENVDAKLSDIAHMTIDSKPSNAKLFINGKNMGVTPYSSDMSSGDYDVEIRHNRYKTFHERVHLDSSNPSVEIALKKQYFRPYSFYMQPLVQVGGNTSIGGAIGTYLANVNLEGYYVAGLKKSEMIYWNSPTTYDKPCGYVYQTSSAGGKLGYGIIFGSQWRLTPQFGLNVVNLKSVEEYNETAAFDASKAYAVGMSIGTRLEFAFASCASLYVTPEYDFATKKSNYFADMEHVSSTIKGFATGFNLKFGLSLFF